MKSTQVVLLILALLAVNTSAKPAEAPENSIYRNLYDLKHRQPWDDDEVQSRADSPVEIKWITQKLDHFDQNNENTWEMRYMSNSEYYQSGGPIFIYVGGESTIKETGISNGRHITDLAKEHNGQLFFTEHRYYGESKPLPDMSVDNLRYLDVRQALEDLAYFITNMKSITPGAQNSSVVLVGGSYPGSMVTWFKKLYPDLIVGAWASSAPLLAKTDFLEYKEVVGQSINDVGGKNCYNRIQNSFAQMQKMYEDKRLAEVKSMYKICNNFDENNQLDVWNFFNYIAEVFSYLVQYAVSGDIETVCKTFNNKEDNYISLAKYIFKNMNSNDACNDLTYKAMIESLNYTSYTGDPMRQWTYQTCNEFGWFQTSTSKSQPFGSWFPLPYSLQICSDLFGEKFTPDFIEQQIQATNEMFGALNPEVENVYFTQGALDPWHAMGINQNVIPLASHCADLRTATENDTTQVLAIRNTVTELVREWLGTTTTK